VLRREDVENFYQQSHFLYVDESAYAGQTYLNLVNRLLGSDLKINMRILDIGCGNGFFLKKMFEAGFTNVGGVEPSKDAAENADPEIKGCIDIRCFSEASHTPNSFELVTVFHLLDHIHEPIEFLNNCRNVLNKDGVIVIVCHDVDALSAKLLGERSPIFDIQHTHLYSQKTIRMLLEKCGFEVMSIGSLWNTYPLGYWIQSLTITEWLAKYIPECIAKIPLTLPAGNLYASARVKK
jgi:SAM-dependent methyltransferase